MQNYGIKVSKEGIDVRTADDKDLVMGSHLNMLKAKETGTLGAGKTRAHGLDYVPIFFAVNKVVGDYIRYTAIWGTQNAGCDASNLENDGSNAIRYYIFYQESR